MQETDGRESFTELLPPILLVDDDPLARAIIAGYLTRLNLCNPFRSLGDGDEAVEFLSSSEVVPSLIILDLELPGRSGLEVLEWIKADGRLGKVPVLMLTSSAELDQIDKAYALGITSYLVKPVGYSALQEIVRDGGFPIAILDAGCLRPSSDEGGTGNPELP